MPSKVSPQAQCFECADETGQQFFVAKQYTYGASGKTVYSYESYNNVDRFLKHYSTIAPKERTYFELIRENRPCLEYYDIEWVLNSDVATAVQEQALLEELVKQRNSFETAHAVNPAHLRVTSASSLEKKKGSMHVVVFGGFAFHNNNVDMQMFMKAFHKHIQEQAALQPVLDEIKLEDAIDWNVYTRNRIMRCLGSIKCKDPERPLVEAHWHQPSIDAAPNEFYITNINVRDTNFKFIDIRQVKQVPKEYSTAAASRTRAIPRSVKTTFSLQDQILVDSIQRSAMDVFRTSRKAKAMAVQFEASGVEPADFGGIRITLRRIKPGPCVLCDRTHDSDNALLETNAVASVSFSCRRQPGTRQELGKMPYAVRIAQRDLLIQRQEIDFPADEEYSEKFLRYCNVPKSLIIRSPTGSGKTRFLKNFVLRNPHLTYIAVSCRRTLADELAKLPGFECYRDITNGRINGPRVVVQAESIWRLDREYYESRADRLVFIMDEFCSLVEQFTSTKTMGGHHQASVTTFEVFQKRALKVIALDADFTATEVELLKEYRDDFHTIHNKHTVHDGDAIVFYENEEALIEETIQRLREDKKLWIVSTHSAERTEAIHKYLTERGFMGKLMTAKTIDSDKRETIKEVKSVLDENAYFIHTPTISVGVDYNVPDVVDSVVGFFNTQSAVTVETCRQMLRRARSVSSKTYLVCVGDKFNNLPDTTSEVAEWLCTMDCMVRDGPSIRPQGAQPAYVPQHVPYDDSTDFKFKLQTSYYGKIYLLVETKRIRSMNDFVGHFVQQMKNAGASVRGANGDRHEALHYERIDEIKQDVLADIHQQIASAPVVGYTEYERLLDRRGTASACPGDEATIRKSYLINMYNLSLDYSMTAEWVSKYNSDQEVEIYKNLCYLHNGIESGLSDLRSTERELMDYVDQDKDKAARSIHCRGESRYVKLKVACDVFAACGFNDPFSGETVTEQSLKDRLEASWGTVITDTPAICMALKMRIPTYKAWTFKNKLYFVNSILTRVLGLKITTSDSRRRQSYKIEHISNVGQLGEVEIQEKSPLSFLRP